MAGPAPLAADTRFNPEAIPAGGLHSLHEDRWESPRNNPMLTSIAKFVDVDMPAAPALPSAPRHQLQGCLLGPLQRKDDAAARHGLYLIDPIEYGYGWVAASAVAHELNAAGIWSTVYDSRHELNAAIIAKGVDLSRVALDPADFVANEPYVGPVHMDFMHETSVRDILDEGARAKLHDNIWTVEAHEFALAEHIVEHEVAGASVSKGPEAFCVTESNCS